MTIATVDPAKPPKRRGNGKSAQERIARLKNAHAVEQAQLELDAQRARDEVQRQIEKRRIEQQERVHRLYVAQEAKRAPQQQIDQPFTLWVLGALGAITFVATAILTADGTIASAAAARFAEPWMPYVLFGAVEVGILAFMLMYYVRGSRIDYDGKPVQAIQWFIAMVFAASVAVALSIYHVLDVYDFDWNDIDMIVGVLIRLVVSLLFVFVSKGLASTIFAKAIHL